MKSQSMFSSLYPTSRRANNGCVLCRTFTKSVLRGGRFILARSFLYSFKFGTVGSKQFVSVHAETLQLTPSLVCARPFTQSSRKRSGLLDSYIFGLRSAVLVGTSVRLKSVDEHVQ